MVCRVLTPASQNEVWKAGFEAEKQYLSLYMAWEMSYVKISKRTMPVLDLIEDERNTAHK